MQQKTAAEYALPYFRSSIRKGFDHYGSNLTRNVILSQDEEAVFSLQDYLAHMLTSFVVPERVSQQEGTGVRGEYVFDLVQQARTSEFTGVRIFTYDHAGKLALFTAAVIPGSLHRTPLKPDDYVEFAQAAYANVVAEQRKVTGDAAPVYTLLARRTDEVAAVLADIAKDDIRMHDRLSGRPLATLEQIAGHEEGPFDVMDEVEELLKSLR